MPLKPCKTAYVYTAQVSSKMIIVMVVRLIVSPKSDTMISDINGVATENVVAVPASSAKRLINKAK